MRIVFSRRRPGAIEFGIIYGGIAALALLAARFLPLLALAPDCAFKALTGLPCPTCGSTRSIVHLVHADFPSALAMNPLIAVTFFGLVIALLYSAVTFVFDLPRIRIVLSENEKNGIRVGIVLILLFNWLYLFLVL